MGCFTNNKIWPPEALQGSNMNCSTNFERSDVKITPFIGQIYGSPFLLFFYFFSLSDCVIAWIPCEMLADTKGGQPKRNTYMYQPLKLFILLNKHDGFLGLSVLDLEHFKDLGVLIFPTTPFTISCLL